MADGDEIDSEFRAEFEALMEKHVQNFAPEGTEMPVVQDWVLMIAVDDAADIKGGGHYMGIKLHSHTYRTKGLLYHGIDMINGRTEETD